MVLQSLSQISKSHITIAPSKYQVTVNPANGKKERVFVDLQAVYPSPEEPGTELSFEEIWAANRGWLDCTWDDDVPDELPEFNENKSSEVDLLSEAVSQKLVVHHDVVMLDENGRIQHHSKEGKSKKKKVIEVNETQISECSSRVCPCRWLTII